MSYLRNILCRFRISVYFALKIVISLSDNNLKEELAFIITYLFETVKYI